jgi:hypothetical protein
VPQSPLPPIDTPNDVTPDLNDDPIVAGLRTLYREVLLEPVPDDFSDLLAQIDAALEAAPDAAEIEPSS